MLLVSVAVAVSVSVSVSLSFFSEYFMNWIWLFYSRMLRYKVSSVAWRISCSPGSDRNRNRNRD